MASTQIRTGNIADSSITDAKVSTGISATKLADGTVSNAALQRIAGLSSDAQTQINAKQAGSAELTGLAGMVTTGVVKRTGSGTFAASTVGDSDIATGVSASKVADGTVSNAAFQRIAGLTSDAQAQLDAKVADVVAGDAIDISGSGTKTVSLSPGLTSPLLPMLWNGQKWENRSAGHDRIIGGHADEHHRYVDREVSVTDRNVIQPQADLIALEIRELSATQSSVLQAWSDSIGGMYNWMDRTGLTVYDTISFQNSGVVFNGIVSGNIPITNGSIWIGNGSSLAAEHPLSGDVTMTNAGVVTITANAVTLAKMATMATASLLGRNTAGTGNPEVLSASTAKSLLSLNNVENTALSTWAGSSNLTTLGTISTGTWSGTTIGLSKGGTNADLSATGGSGQVLRQSSSGAAITVGTLSHSEVTGLATGDPHTQYAYLSPSSSSRNILQPTQDIETALVLRAAPTDTPSVGSSTFWGIQNNAGVLQFGVVNTDCVPTAVQTILPVEFRNRTICKFFEATGGGSNFIGLRAPAALSSDYTYDLPTSYGTSGQFMQTNGTGTLSWASLVAGDIPNLAASKITSGQLALARGGTNADLSATGGTSQVLKQTTSGGAVTVGQLAISDISGVGGTNVQSQITSDQNDYVLGTSNTQTVYTISADANGRTITGIAGGAAGRVINILNTGTKDIIFAHQSASSTASNRLQLPIELDMVLRPNDCWTLVYDTVSSRWYVTHGYAGYLNDPAFVSSFDDDFVLGTNGNGTFGELGWSFNNNGGTPSITADETAYLGACKISSGTTASGRGELVLNNPVNMNLLTGMVLQGTIRISATTGLSASTAGITAYSLLFAVSNSMSRTGVVSGVTQVMGFFYDRVGVNANWQCVTAGGSSTVTDSSVAVSTSYQRLKIVFNTAGTEAKFYINESLVATHTTNFPSSGPYTVKFGIWNDATSSHTSMIAYMDNFSMKVYRTSRRS